MTIAPYRVHAYNTAKQSENKMHDDTVAKRFGFSGGLVPGVDVMAYMMHQPVAEWGRAFLERGLIDARFLKRVDDGELAELTAAESNGVLSIEVQSRGEVFRATGTASLPASAPAFALGDYREVAAVAERRPVDAASYELGKWLGTAPRDGGREGGQRISCRYQGSRSDLREAGPGSSRPAATGDEPGAGRQRHFGAFIHVGSRMQLLSAAKSGDVITARAKVIGNYDKKGHRFVELDALVVGNGQRPLAHCHHIAIYQPREQAAA